MRTMCSAFSIRPYVEESTASCPICEVKSQSACGSSWVGYHQRSPGVECKLLDDILSRIIDTSIRFRCVLCVPLSAFDHTLRRAPHPVQFAKLSLNRPVVVVGWVTTSDHRVLNAIFWMIFYRGLSIRVFVLDAYYVFRFQHSTIR